VRDPLGYPRPLGWLHTAVEQLAEHFQADRRRLVGVAQDPQEQSKNTRTMQSVEVQ
jgi:hypothetical protein